MPSTPTMRVAIIGGGAAGFFLAIRLKELSPLLHVTIFERQQRVLRKVEVSGGGRCNCTNTFARVSDLAQVYPRGHRLLKALFRHFGPEDARQWFEAHDVPLVAQDDECIFPAAQDSHAIIDCFLSQCRKLGIEVLCGVDGFAEAMPGGQLAYDYIAVTTGGMTPALRKHFDEADIIPPLPSLFTFNIADPALTALMGAVADDVIASIPGTRLKTRGPLLITHWGMSGPAILKLSSHAARLLADNAYSMPMAINWVPDETTDSLSEWYSWAAEQYGSRLVGNVRLPAVPARLWEYLLGKAGIAAERKWGEVGRKQMNRLTECLTNDTYTITGRCHYKDEFVTCGGIALSAVQRDTLESRRTPHLYFAGEILDIDGVTGGFNLQAAWTTADAVARAIAQEVAQ